MVSVELGDLSIDDEDQTMQVQNMNIDKDSLPRKHMGHSVVLTDNVKCNDRMLSLKTISGADPIGKTRPKAADYDIGT